MATDTCSTFQAHLFKKELCANCLKPQTQHGNKVSGGNSSIKNSALVKSLPTIAPVASKTPVARGSIFAGLIEAAGETKNGSADNTANGHNEAQLNGGAPSVPPPKTNRQGSQQQIQRPKAPPPTTPDATTAQTITMIKPAVKAEAESHYYHKYGIGLKEKVPETMKVVSESDAGTETILVALPYAAVEIATNPPNYQLHLPPKLPVTPSPMDKLRDGQSTLGRNKSESPKLSPNVTNVAPPKVPPAPAVIGPYEVVEIDSSLQKAADKNGITKDSENKLSVLEVKDSDVKGNDAKDEKNTMKKNKSFLKKLFRIKDKDDPGGDEDSAAGDGDTPAPANNTSENSFPVPGNKESAVKLSSDNIVVPLACVEDDGLTKAQTATLGRKRMPPAQPPPPAPAPIPANGNKPPTTNDNEFTKSVDDISSMMPFKSNQLNGDKEIKDNGNKKQTSSLERQVSDKKNDDTVKSKVNDKSTEVVTKSKINDKSTEVVTKFKVNDKSKESAKSKVSDKSVETHSKSKAPDKSNDSLAKSKVPDKSTESLTKSKDSKVSNKSTEVLIKSKAPENSSDVSKSKVAEKSTEALNKSKVPEKSADALIKSTVPNKSVDILTLPKELDKSKANGKSVSEVTNISPTTSPRALAKNIELDLKDLGLSSVMEAIEDIFKKNAPASDISPSNSSSQLGSKESSGDGSLSAGPSQTSLPSVNRQCSNLSDDCADSTSSRIKERPVSKVKPGRPMQAPPPPPPVDVDKRRASALELNSSSPPTSPLMERSLELAGRGSAIPTAFDLDVILPTKAEKTSAFSRDSFAFGTLPKRLPLVTRGDSKVDKSKKNKEAVKKSRYKTLTEGIGVDIEIVSALAVDDVSKQAQLAEDRKNKFMNRELPPLPLEALHGDDNAKDDDLNNLYEFVPVKSDDADGVDGKGVSVADKAEDKKKKKVTIFDVMKGGGKKPVSNNADYLLPTDDSSDETSPSAKKAPGRPKKLAATKSEAVRSSSPAKADASKPTSSSYVMVYANAVPLMEQFRCAITSDQALAKIATVNLDTLQQIYDLKRKEIGLSATADFHDELCFSDFTVLDEKPELTHGPAAFYRVECLLLSMDSGLVMCTTKKPSRDMVDSAQLHFLQPCHTFQDLIPASLLPKDAPTSLKASNGRYHAWVWVTDYEKVYTLATFLTEMRQIIGRCTEQLERYISYSLAQILDGVLGSHDSKHPVFTLKPADILAVTCGERPEKFLVINPACIKTSDNKAFKPLFLDLIRVVFFLLNIDCPSTMESDVLLLKIPRRSRYSHALRLLVTFMLTGSTFQDVLYARNFLEFLLWGPNEDEVTTMNLTKDPAGAFSLWLDMARHRTVAKFAREHHAASVELTHMLRFYCTETGVSLRNIAALFLGSAKEKQSSVSAVIKK